MRAAILLCTAFLLSACVTLQPARMTLPDGLAERSELIELRGLGSGQRGSSEWPGHALRFERDATRLALFDELAVTDRANVRYALTAPGGTSQASCGMRRRTSGAGVVSFIAKPLAFHCDFAPALGQLALYESQGGVRTLKAAREGELRWAGRTLRLRSVHTVQGAIIDVAQPIGYVVEDGGRAVAAVELNGTRPRLFLPRGDAALRSASLHALLAVALLWDPAEG